MKVVLITKSLQRIEIDIDAPDSLGVIIRQDTRKNPPIRVFHFVSRNIFSHVSPPEFHETDYHYLDDSGLPDDVWDV